MVFFCTFTHTHLLLHSNRRIFFGLLSEKRKLVIFSTAKAPARSMKMVCTSVLRNSSGKGTSSISWLSSALYSVAAQTQIIITRERE